MKIYVYGDITCRGDVDMKRSTLDSDEILEYIKASESGEDALDDFLESTEEAIFKKNSKNMKQRRIELDRFNLIGMFSWEKNPRAIYNKLIKGKHVHLMGEEELFGYGLTKEAAMVAYAKGNADELGVDDDGEEW